MSSPAGSQRLVVVGHASRDLVPDDPRGWRLGGSVSYVSLAAARLGIAVRALIGLDRESATAPELDLLREAGVELRPLVFPQAPVFRNVETSRGRKQECLAAGPPLLPRDVPQEWRAAGAWAFVPVLDELGGKGWAGLPGRDAVVAVGWQGLLREARAGGPTHARAPRPDALLERADVTIASEDDLPASGAGRGGPAGATRLAGLFPRAGQALVLTRGVRGGRLLVRTDRAWRVVRYSAVPGRVVADETGSGDVFLGAYLAMVLDPALAGPEKPAGRGGTVRHRLRVAAVAAAMATEGPGLTTVPTRPALLARLAASGG